MADSLAAQTPSLSEQYHLEKVVKQEDTNAKPEEAAPEVVATPSEEINTDQTKEEESPVVEEKSESPASTEEAAPPAVAATEDNAEEAPPAAEENNDENSNEEEVVAEETPDEIKLETAPADFRFPTTNQTRHCFTRYIEYHRCVAAKGDDAPECDKFAKFYRSLCPSEWVDRWNEQRENGTFPGPL